MKLNEQRLLKLAGIIKEGAPSEKELRDAMADIKSKIEDFTLTQYELDKFMDFADKYFKSLKKSDKNMKQANKFIKNLKK